MPAKNSDSHDYKSLSSPAKNGGAKSDDLSASLKSPMANCMVSAYQAKAGSMWASFACPSVEAPPSEYCTASGFFVLENCEQ